MKPVYQQYTEQIKMLFPLMDKPEKDYLNKMAVQVKDYCEDNQVESLENLYENFDRPEDVVREYYSIMDTEDIITRIKRTKLLRTLVICIVIIAMAISTSAITRTVLYYKAYQEALDNIHGYWVDSIE